MDKELDEMGLSEYEYGFYTAAANNKSTKELIIVLFEKSEKMHL